MSIKEDLSAVFGSIGSSISGSALIMNQPSGVTKEQATFLVDRLSMKPVMKDLGAIVAREIGNELSAHGMRPADFATLPDLGDTVIERLIQELQTDPEEFTRSLLGFLAMKG